MARPLPKTKAPAFRKKVKRPKPVVRLAGPWVPVVSHVRPAGSATDAEDRIRVLTIIATMPQRTKSQMISDFVQAGAIALRVNKTHSKESAFSVVRGSLYTLRARIATTAAPNPSKMDRN